MDCKEVISDEAYLRKILPASDKNEMEMLEFGFPQALGGLSSVPWCLGRLPSFSDSE
jgi:hypothetical protein